MNDMLRIYVLWASGSESRNKIAELISRHFDGIGMERDGGIVTQRRIPPLLERSENVAPAKVELSNIRTKGDGTVIALERVVRTIHRLERDRTVAMGLEIVGPDLQRLVIAVQRLVEAAQSP